MINTCSPTNICRYQTLSELVADPHIKHRVHIYVKCAPTNICREWNQHREHQEVYDRVNISEMFADQHMPIAHRVNIYVRCESLSIHHIDHSGEQKLPCNIQRMVKYLKFNKAWSVTKNTHDHRATCHLYTCPCPWQI